MKAIHFFSLFILVFLSFSCEDCDPIEMEVCGGPLGDPKVDLIVLIDASGSMGVVANTIDMAAQMAVQAALDTCPTDLNVTYLGVDGSWAGTVFNDSHRNYIYAAQGTIPLAADAPHVGLPQEQGANAIEDLSNYAPWRENACRAIFYISDEELDSISPAGDFANEDAVTAAAITAAQANGVTVFTHYITQQGRAPQILQNYNDLTAQTGGFNLTTPTYAAVDQQLYLDLMPQIVCNSCQGCELAIFE
ncbi:MAG: hypothetical protein AAF433_21500 [Bacteroidota bacterium]